MILLDFADSEHVHLKLPALRPFLPDDINEFYRYHGSLTTPPCHEAVVWTVFKNPITMSEAQVFVLDVYEPLNLNYSLLCSIVK